MTIITSAGFLGAHPSSLKYSRLDLSWRLAWHGIIIPVSVKNKPPEENTLVTVSLKNTKSRAGEEFLLLDCKAKAGRKGVFSQTPVSCTAYGRKECSVTSMPSSPFPQPSYAQSAPAHVCASAFMTRSRTPAQSIATRNETGRMNWLRTNGGQH